MDLATLGVRVTSDGVVKTTNELDGLENAAGKTERAANSLGNAFRMLTPIVGALGAAFSIRALTGYADAWSDMQSRVGAAVKNMEAAPALMQRMVDVANASYSPLQQTVEIYGRNVAVLRDLGRNAVEAADFTEALNHALVTTATKGQDADVVLNALSRSISTGKLRAMEYETIMSRSPRVLEAVAESMGTTVTGLRQMAVEGKVTGGVIVDALIGSLEQLREEAGEMPATVGDAVVRIQTNFGALIGRLDQATGASQNFALALIAFANGIAAATDPAIEMVSLLADNFDRLTFYATGFAAFMAGPYVAAMITSGAATTGLAATLVALRAAIAGTGIGLLVLLITDVLYRIYDATVGVKEFGQTLENTTEPARSLFDTLKIGAEAIYATFDWLAAGISAAMMGAFATIYTAYADLVNGINAGLRLVGIEQRDMDRNWAGGIANDLGQQRDQAFRQMTHKFGQLTGGGDPILGAFEALGGAQSYENVDEMWAAMSAGGPVMSDLTEKAAVLAGAVDGVGGSLTAANDNIYGMQEALALLDGAAASPFDTLHAQMAGLDELLAQGKISWQEYGDAAFRANSMAASSVLGLASGLTGALSQMFQDNKAFAVANAVVSTAEAVMKALSIYGPTPWGFAAAGVAAATGAAQIASIMSANKGRSSVAGVSGGGAVPAAAAQAPSDQRVISISLGGRSYSREDVRELIEQMNEEMGDGVVLRVNGAAA